MMDMFYEDYCDFEEHLLEQAREDESDMEMFGNEDAMEIWE